MHNHNENPYTQQGLQEVAANSADDPIEEVIEEELHESLVKIAAIERMYKELEAQREALRDKVKEYMARLEMHSASAPGIVAKISHCQREKIDKVLAKELLGVDYNRVVSYTLFDKLEIKVA